MASFVLAMAIGVLPTDPAEVYDSAAVALDSVNPADRPYVRFLSLWPASLEQQESLSAALSFWTNSLSWNPRLVQPRLTDDGALWLLDLRDYGWSREAWEKLAATDVYFAVSVKNSNGEIQRGWLDPKVEATVRYATGSQKAVLRADYFLARTSIDGKKADGFLREGFYSDFLNLPKTDAELKTILKAEDKVKVPSSSGYDIIVFLLYGGAVKESLVALHNRGLQVRKTLIGRDESFQWESLDTDSNAGAASVQKNLGGTVKRAGGEFIFSLPNGAHGYFICNAKGERLSEVPTSIAQHKGHARETVVLLGRKCNECHGPASGIIGFDDVIRPQIVDRNTALAVIAKGKADKDVQEEKQRNEAYYLADLKEIREKHRKSYLRVIDDINGMTPEENSKNYVRWAEAYLYELVDREAAIRETGFGDEFDRYVKLTSPDTGLSPLTTKVPGKVPRDEFEEDFPRLMQAKVWPWEQKK